MIEFILTNNYFEFNNTFYQQIHGTAMGTAMAPLYANLFMAYLEESFLDTQTRKPYLWLRYIDDIFIIWLHSEKDLKDFISNLNQSHPTIKYTSESSRTTINYLDITVNLNEGIMTTNTYHKPTDANNYLHYKSSHPKHQKESIPFSQYLRMKRNNSTDEGAKQSIDKLEQAFHQRGYPKITLDRSKTAVEPTTQLDLLNNPIPDQKKTNDKIIFVTTYHPGAPAIKKSIMKYSRILNQHPHTNHLVDSSFITAFRRPSNLRDILVHSRYKPMDIQPPKGTYRCNKNCHSCQHILELPTYTNTDGTKTFSTKSHITCETTYVIYLITCDLCHKKYVGQTSKNIKIRTYQHLYDIKKDHAKPVAIHFNSQNHTCQNLKIQGICQASRNITKRLSLEQAWIKVISTYQPWGMNVKT